MTLHTDTPERFGRAIEALDGGYDIGAEAEAPPVQSVILDRVR